MEIFISLKEIKMEEQKYITPSNQDLSAYVITVEDRRLFRKICAAEKDIKGKRLEDMDLELIRLSNLYSRIMRTDTFVYVLPWNGDVRQN